MRNATDVTMRNYRPGDFGLIIKRHAEMYSQEFGYPLNFETYVVEAIAKFAKALDPEKDRIFIAERGPEFLGSAAIQMVSAKQAQLRFVLVEAAARGLGLGRQLVSEAVQHAQSVGARTVKLETASNLLAARTLYDSLGFVFIAQTTADFLPSGVLSETWQLTLP